MVYFLVTGRLSFLTLYRATTLSRGFDSYPVSTGGAFQFGDGYVYSVYVSTVEKDTCVHCVLSFSLVINVCMVLSVVVRFNDTCIHCDTVSTICLRMYNLKYILI